MIGLTELIVLLSLLIVPLFLISFVDVLRHDFKGNDKLVWLVAVIFVPFLGPICYFKFGREKKIESNDDARNK